MTEPRLLTHDLLEGLRQRWERLGVPVARYVRPGLDEAALDSAEHRFGRAFPLELRRWWGWADGAPAPKVPGPEPGVDYLAEINPGPELLSSGQALEEAARMQHYAARGAAPPDIPASLFWDPSWIPVTANRSGGVLACSTAGEPDAPCAMRYVEFGFTELPPAITVPSLGQLVLWWTEIYDAGGYVYDVGQQRWVPARGATYPGLNDWYVGG